MKPQAGLDLHQDDLFLGDAGRTAFRVLVGLGVAGLAVAGFLGFASEGGMRSLLPAYLTSFLFFLSLSLGALFFVLVQHATRAGWSVAVRRLAEGVAPSVLLPLAILVLPVLWGMPDLYPWAVPENVASDPLLQEKSAWLNVPFFLVRTAIYFGVWTILSFWFLRKSVKQDETGDPGTTKRMETTSTAGLILFAFTVTYFSFDYVMSLTPHWYSTIFGVYFFAGCVLSFFALLIVIAIAVQGAGRLRNLITAEHYHDLGKLMFAFTVFWAYIGFSQYMLMWYANLPEETIWYAARQTGGWTAVSVALLFGHFFLPFLVLMSRGTKRRKPILLAGALWMLAMQWLDVFWLVRPAGSPGTVPFGVADVATFVGVGGIFLAACVRRLSAHALVPVKDPRLAESLRFENF